MTRMKPRVSRWVKELPEGAVPVRARTDESSLIWTSPEDAVDQKPLTVCWVGPAKRGFWQTLLGSALARGTWMEVPVFPQPPRPAKPAATTGKKSWDDVEVKAGRRLRIEPYDPDARDGDNDGIVQEGTAWERPAGTRLLDQAGKEIERGLTATSRASGLRVVDRDGKDVPFTPSYGAKKPAAGRGRISRAPQLGVTIGDQMEQGRRQRPAVPEGARAAEEIRRPSLLDPKGVREARKKGLLRGLPEDPRGWPPRLPWRPGDSAELRRRDPELQTKWDSHLTKARQDAINRAATDLRQIRVWRVRGLEGTVVFNEREHGKLVKALDELEAKYGGTEKLAEHLVDEQLKRQRRILEDVRDQPMVISVVPQHLVKLLDDGRYRTQFETGTSGGAYSPGHRRAVEQRFGIPADEGLDVLRPVYGSLIPLEGKGAQGQGIVTYGNLPGAAYGGAQVILRERVRSRSSMTMGDSFGNQWGLPLTGEFTDEQMITANYEHSGGQQWLYRAHHEAFADLLEEVGYTREDAQAYRKAAEAATGMTGEDLIYKGYPQLAGDIMENVDPMGANESFRSSYLELQVHGGITLHDVAAIHIIETNVMADQRSEIQARADELGITVVWVDLKDRMTDIPRR